MHAVNPSQDLASQDPPLKFNQSFRALCRRMVAIAILCFFIPILGACSVNQRAAADQTPDVLAAYGDRPRLEGEATVLMEVATASGTGEVTLVLAGAEAPLTAGNFADLVQKGFYNGLKFHRVVNEPVPFVAQGGDPLGNGTGGYTDPTTSRPRQIPLEILVSGETTPRYDTVFDQAQISQPPALSHTRRALAMARSQAPNSASSQFYITLADQPMLDGRYAVFGYVTDGMDIVDQIRVGDTIVSMTITSGADLLVNSGS